MMDELRLLQRKIDRLVVAVGEIRDRLDHCLRVAARPEDAILLARSVAEALGNYLKNVGLAPEDKEKTTARAKKIMEDIKAGGKFSECHFIEFMACPGGCIGGGGQPIPTTPEIRAKRAEAIYAEDDSLELRKSHNNPYVKMIYEKFFTDGPCGHLSHKLLHTHYTKRGKFIA